MQMYLTKLKTCLWSATSYRYLTCFCLGFLLFQLALIPAYSQHHDISEVWVADNGDGT